MKNPVCTEYGAPGFISAHVSYVIRRLSRHAFPEETKTSIEAFQAQCSATELYANAEKSKSY